MCPAWCPYCWDNVIQIHSSFYNLKLKWTISSVRNKLVFSYNMLGAFTRKNLCLPFEENALICAGEICIAQVHKLKLCTCSWELLSEVLHACMVGVNGSLPADIGWQLRNCDCDRQMSLCHERRGKKLLIIYFCRNPESGHCGSSEKLRTKTAL